MRRFTLTAALALGAALVLTGCSSLGLGSVADLEKLNEVFEELEQASEAFDEYEKGQEAREEWNSDGERGVDIPGDATMKSGGTRETNPSGGPGPFGDRDEVEEFITYDTTLEQAKAGYEEHKEKYAPEQDDHEDCNEVGCWAFSHDKECSNGECSRGYSYWDNKDGTAKVKQDYRWKK